MDVQHLPAGVLENIKTCVTVYRLVLEGRSSLIEEERGKDTRPVFCSYAAETNPLNVVNYIQSLIALSLRSINSKHMYVVF